MLGRLRHVKARLSQEMGRVTGLIGPLRRANDQSSFSDSFTYLDRGIGASEAL